jgi:hypothetical protein
MLTVRKNRLRNVDQQLQRTVTDVSGSSLRPGMEVYRADGGYMGLVSVVGEADFLVKRRWQGDVRIPLEWVLAVMGARVLLTAGPARPGPGR